MERLVPSENFCLTRVVPREIAWLAALTVAVWVCALLWPPTRRAYLNGWRCLGRHTMLWKIPAGFTLCYGIFQLTALLLLSWRLETAPVLGTWTSPTSFSPIILSSLLPATESLAAIFNCLVATFPLSAVAAMLFLFNTRGLTAELGRTLFKVFGWKGHLLFLLLLLCAMASLLKPALILVLPELINRWPFGETLIGATLINALSFAFEYMLGTCFQIYLLLVAFGWVRGTEFDSEKLLRFAVRRMGFVFKWALVIVATTIALLQLPMLAGILFTGVPAPAGTESYARLLLAVVMITLAGVQIRLVLHNETLGRAIGWYWRFLHRQGFSLSLFLLTAATLLLPWKILEILVTDGFGESVLGQSGAILTQSAGAIFGGWILASWVCFYKSSESRKSEIAF